MLSGHFLKKEASFETVEGHAEFSKPEKIKKRSKTENICALNNI